MQSCEPFVDRMQSQPEQGHERVKEHRELAQHEPLNRKQDNDEDHQDSDLGQKPARQRENNCGEQTENDLGPV